MTGLRRRRLGGLLVALCVPALVLWLPGAVGAQVATIDIPLETVVRGPEGSEHLLASEDVPADLVGSSCTVQAAAENQSSVHPDNDLVVASGGDQIVLENVEREPGAETEGEGSLSLGEELTVTLVMGPDEVFSAGITVTLTCEPADTTTTTETTTPTTDTTSPPTTEETTTTTEDTTTTTVLGTTVTTAPTTTAAEDTTTTEVAGTDTLPFTGGGTGGAAGVALAALVMGAALVTVTRRAAEGGGES